MSNDRIRDISCKYYTYIPRNTDLTYCYSERKIGVWSRHIDVGARHQRPMLGRMSNFLDPTQPSHINSDLFQTGSKLKLKSRLYALPVRSPLMPKTFDAFCMVTQLSRVSILMSYIIPCCIYWLTTVGLSFHKQKPAVSQPEGQGSNRYAA